MTRCSQILSRLDHINEGKYGATAIIDSPVIERVAEIADRYSVPRIRVALAWLMQKDICTVPICGATKPNHPVYAASAVGFTLSKDEIVYLEEPYQPHNVTGALGKPSK